MPVYSTDKGRLCPDCGAAVHSGKCQAETHTAAGDGFVRLQRQVKGRNGKPVTIVSGLDLALADLKKMAKKLKSKCGVGGSIDGANIIIQGDKRDVLKATLETDGYKVKLSGG